MQHISKITDEVAAFRKRWAEALTSGAFTRCEGVMALGGSHCCLGVAYVVATGEPVPANNLDLAARSAAYSRVYCEAGLDNAGGRKCMTWNDQEHLSFAEIARKILGGELEAS